MLAFADNSGKAGIRHMDVAGIGERISQLRKQQGWSLNTLATKMQLRGHDTISFQRIFEIETGERDVSASEAISFARIFRVPITYVLGVPDQAPD